MVNAGTLAGVADVRDESDRDGMRVVVELKRNVNAQVNSLPCPCLCSSSFPQ